MKILVLILLSIVSYSIVLAQDTREPGMDEFIEVDVEPVPQIPLGKLIVYPPEARKDGIEGKVIITALIDTNGRVIKTAIEKSDNKIFEDAARNALMQERFSPATSAGKPVKVWYTIPITFRMSAPPPVSQDPNRKK